jgi:hypothetical protein
MMFRRFVTVVGCLLVLGLVPAAGVQLPFRENWDAVPLSSYVDGGRVGTRWIDAWNGGGFGGIVTAAGHGRVLQLAPEFTTNADTHSGLVLSDGVFGHSDSSVQMRTLRKVKSKPNPWEVGWLLVDYHRDSCGNNVFYYLILKDGAGWELGKTYSDGKCGFRQQFLGTGPGAFALGVWYTPRIRISGGELSAYDGGDLLGTAVDSGVNGGRYVTGRVGFYTEDAVVQFDAVLVR